MAKITGQTGLVLATTSSMADGNVFIDTTAFTIKVAQYGSLTSDGVTLQALYSFLMTQWKDGSFEMFKFPMESITPGEFELRNGWDFADDTTRYLLRDGGWNLLNATNSTIYEVWAGIQTLGTIGETDQVYYIHTADGTPTDFELPGPVNQAIKIYGDATHGNFDYRLTSNSELVLFVRIQGKTYASYNLNIEQAKASLKNNVYALPLTNGTDLDISATDNDIETLAPYTGMSITWGAVQRTIGGVARDFSIVIDGNSGTLQEIYEFVQYKLRQATDIDAGVAEHIGLISDEMLQFVGPTLKTKLTSDGGVYIDNFLSSDTNSIVFVDDTGTERTYPYVAAGRINFNDNLQADGANAKYWMYFADAGGNLFNTSNAIIVDDASGVDIAGVINGVSFIEFDFDYDGNVQGGRTAGTEAPVVLVAIGTVNAQYVSATGTITRSTLNSFTLTAAKERNYVA